MARFPFLLILLATTIVSGQVRLEDFAFETYDPGTRILISGIETKNYPRVKLFASVSRGGLPVGGMLADNFRVHENQTVLRPDKVTTQRVPVSVALVYDARKTNHGVFRFVRILEESDQFMVVQKSPFDGVRNAIEAVENVHGKKAVVAFSDENRNLAETLLVAIRANVPVFTIGEANSEVLRTIAGTTGGFHANAASEAELSTLIEKLGQPAGKYEIEYTSENQKAGGLREVKLESAFPRIAAIPVSNHVGRTSYEIPELIEPDTLPIAVSKNHSNQIIAANGRDVVVSGQDGVIIISGGCGKLTISGGGNQVQCDVVDEIEISGDKNVLVIGSLGKGAITGSGNELSWGRGLNSQKPGVTASGMTNRVKRLE